MHSINSFINLLGKNYYSDFLINVNTEVIDLDSYSILVRYNSTYYYELNNTEILLKRNELISTIKEQFQQALSEVYSMLLSQDQVKLNSYLELNIKTVKSHLNTLKKDFYIDSNQSRYYSVLEDNPTMQDLDIIYQDNLRKEDFELDKNVYEIIDNSNFKKVESLYFLGFLYHRYKTLSFIPFSLFQIGKQFLIELDKIRLLNEGKVNEDSNISKNQSKMKDTYFSKFCEMIDDIDILSKSTAFGVMIDFQQCIKEIKSETLSELLEKGDNKNDYLDFKINEVEKQSYSKNADINFIKKWIDKYQFRLTDLFNNSIQDNPIYILISSHYKELEKYSEETLNVYYLQLDFYQYFCKHYADELIAFFESRKNKVASNSDIISNEINETIKWIGKPSQLGFIIGKLAELGYIETPVKPNGDTNYTQFANLVNNTFDVSTTKDTLSKYLNLESEKGQETERKFAKNGFKIPHIKEIS